MLYFPPIFQKEKSSLNIELNEEKIKRKINILRLTTLTTREKEWDEKKNKEYK